MTPEKKAEVEEVVRKHSRCLTNKRGFTTLTQHLIETGEAKPLRSAPRRLSEAERKIVQEQVKEMLDEGIISP